MNTSLVNQGTLNLQSTITDDWGDRHRIAISLEALTTAENWKIEVSLPENYEIDEIYYAKIIREGNKTYLAGEESNKYLSPGGKTEIILIIDEGDSGHADPIEIQLTLSNSLVNNNHQSNEAIKSNSQITEDWEGGYKLELDIMAESTANNWQLDFNLPYSIREVHGVDLIDNGNGNYSISGQNDQVNLKSGQSIKPIFIIDDYGQEALGLGITNNLSTVPNIQSDSSSPTVEAAIESKANGQISVAPIVTEDWEGGYKLELDITAESTANDWQLDFNLPYSIKEVHGVDLIDNGNGNYSISGQNDQVSLQQGQSIKPIFIVDDYGQQALNPQFDASINLVTPEPEPISRPNNTPLDIDNTPAQTVGQEGQFNYGEALQKNFLFFEANRSGALPDDNRLQWRKDSTTNDGNDVGRDLNGGYFDAGDHIKFIQPMAFSNTMLAWGGADYKQAYAQSGQLDELLEAVKWGTDWFLKAHETDSAGKTERLWVQVGDQADHDHWVSPEAIESKAPRPSFAIDRNNPGSDAAAGTASALASAAVLFRGVDDAYADELVKNAEALYEFAETYKGKYSDSVPQASPFYTSWSGYGDELALGGAWLYRATGEDKYLAKAEDYFKSEVGTLGDWAYATDNHSYAAATLLAKDSSDDFFKNQTKTWLDTWQNGGGSVNYTSGGFAHRANWASVPLTMSAAYSAQWYSDHVEYNQGYEDFATEQVDYVLGDNPANLSYVVGFGDNYPQRTHHRGSAGSAGMDGSDQVNDHILYGAVVGGPESVDDFSHNDRRNDWITNEVGTSYNAPFAGAAIQQYENLGGDPLTDAQLDQLIGVDADGVGF